MTSRLVSVLAAVAVGVSSVALFTPISASATVSTVTLTSAQTVALFGNTIPCEYLSTDGTYHQTTATYSSTWSNSYQTAYSPDGQSFLWRDVCQYTIPYASDMQTNPADITLFFETAVDVSALTYFDTAIVQYSNMDFTTQLYGTYTDYWYCSDGYHYPLRQGADNTPGYNLYGYIGAEYKYTVLPCLYTSPTSGAFSTGWAKCGSFKDTTYANSYCIGIVAPVISTDWQFDGNTGAGSGSGSGESSGGGSDSGSGTDLSGVTSRLDQIISLLDEIADNTSTESSGSSSSDSSADDLVDQFDSDMDYITSGLNQMDGLAAAADSVSFVDAEYTDIYQPVRDLVGVAPSEQSRSGDEGSTEEWLKEQLDGVPNPFFISMQVTALIALISFVIFGKRGGG